MTSAQSKNLTLIAGGVLVAGTLLQHHYATAKESKSVVGAGEQQVTQTWDLGRKLAPIGILVIVMMIFADQIPDFAGPFALLVMIAYLATHMDVFNKFAKEQG